MTFLMFHFLCKMGGRRNDHLREAVRLNKEQSRGRIRRIRVVIQECLSLFLFSLLGNP